MEENRMRSESRRERPLYTLDPLLRTGHCPLMAHRFPERGRGADKAADQHANVSMLSRMLSRAVRSVGQLNATHSSVAATVM